MRRITLLLAMGVVLSACGFFKRGGQPPAHRSPTTTSIWGDWVLASSADSTAFAGASTVELSLSQTSFTINATYPGRTTQRITGSVATGEGGILTLIPQTGSTDATYARRSMSFVAGQPIQLLASAAGATLVFKPPQDTDPTPSSVWSKRSMAEAAGKIGKDSTP